MTRIYAGPQLEDYVYPNDNGPRNDWYHDHGIHNTVRRIPPTTVMTV